MSDLRLRRKRWSTLTYRLATLIAVLMGVSALLTTTFAVRSVQDALYSEVSQSMANVHAAVEGTIVLGYESVEDFRQAELETRRDTLRDIAAPINASLDALKTMADNGTLTPQQAQQNALEMLKSIRFGQNDYFFTYDRDMTAIAHPDPQFQGRNLIDLQDPNGKFVLREIRDVALTQGSGFVDYEWVRLNETEPVPKIGYVFHYQPWDWIIGTGVYVDDIDVAAQVRLAEVQAQLEQTLAGVTFSQDSTFFILNQQGEIIVTPADSVALGWFSETDAGRQAARSIALAAPAAGLPTTTSTIDASLREGQSETWVIESSTIPELDWVLVSAVPQAELQGPGRRIAIQQLVMSISVLILGVGAGLMLSRRLVRPVEDVTKAAIDLGNNEFAPEQLDRAAKRTDEVGELARTFQRMGTELAERERRLRDQVAKLKVEVDRSKLAKSVEEITESDYFQRIKAQADEIRKRARADRDADQA